MLNVSGLAGTLVYKPQPKAPVAPVAEPAPKTETGTSFAEQPSTPPQKPEEVAAVVSKPAEPVVVAAPAAPPTIPVEPRAELATPRATDALASRPDRARPDDTLVRDLPSAIAADLDAVAAEEHVSRAAAEAARASIRTSLLIEGLSIPVKAVRDPSDNGVRAAADRYDAARPATGTALPEPRLAKVA